MAFHMLLGMVLRLKLASSLSLWTYTHPTTPGYKWRQLGVLRKLKCTCMSYVWRLEKALGNTLRNEFLSLAWNFRALGLLAHATLPHQAFLLGFYGGSNSGPLCRHPHLTLLVASDLLLVCPLPARCKGGVGRGLLVSGSSEREVSDRLRWQLLQSA